MDAINPHDPPFAERTVKPPFGDLITLPGQAPPPGGQSGIIPVRRRGFRFGPKVVHLRWAVWRPKISRKGTVCLFHGRTEFIEKYYETIQDLLDRGFTVATMDWRGQGGSTRARQASPTDERSYGYVASFGDYIADLSAFMRQIVYPLCPGPHFALSHSMSGPIMLLAAAKRRPFWFDRMVLCAPMLRLPLGMIGPRGLRTLSGTLALTGLSRLPLGRVPVRAGVDVDFRENCLTSDPKRFADAQKMIDAVPSLTVGPPTVGWVNAASRAMDACFDLAFPRRVQVPVLFVGAAKDTVVDTRATEMLAQRMRSGSYVMIPGAKHEILMERDALRNQFWAAFDEFIPGESV